MDHVLSAAVKNVSTAAGTAEANATVETATKRPTRDKLWKCMQNEWDNKRVERTKGQSRFFRLPPHPHVSFIDVLLPLFGPLIFQQKKGQNISIFCCCPMIGAR